MTKFILLSSDEIYLGWVFLPVLGLLGTYGVLLLIIILPVIIRFIFRGIALNKMSKNAGYIHPGLSFVPIAQTYVEFILPKRDFKLLFLKSHDRKMMAFITILFSYPGLLGALAANVIPVIGTLIGALIPIVAIGLNWKKKYDLLSTFYTEESTIILLSIIGTVFPTAYSVILLVIMNRIPEYGYGKYYSSVTIESSNENTADI